MKRLFFMMVVSMGCASAPPALPVASEVQPAPVALEPTDDPLVGELRYRGGDAERAQLEASIVSATEEMNFLIRGIARDRIEEANQPPQLIRLSHQGQLVTVVIDGRRYQAAIGGPPAPAVGVLGGDVEVTLRLEGDDLVQTIRNDEGARENTFRSIDEDTVMLDVRIFSERLPADVRYSLTYGRNPPLATPP